MSSGYKIIEHTADCGVKVWGNTLEELFIESFMATASVLVDINLIETVETKSMHIEGETLTELLHRSLSELLYLMQQNEMLYKEFHFEKSNFSENNVDRYVIDLLMSGEPIDLSRHSICKEIKAVTHHDFYVKRKGLWWEAGILFDV